MKTVRTSDPELYIRTAGVLVPARITQRRGGCFLIWREDGGERVRLYLGRLPESNRLPGPSQARLFPEETGI